MGAAKVLLVGWDAADWKVIYPLMAEGKMPNVQRLVASGTRGQIATLHPPLSPILWTSIATGKRPFKHGIYGFAEPTRDGRGVQPITNLSRKSKAVWNILNQNHRRSVVVGWWPSHPAEPIDGVMVSDHFHRAVGPPERGWPAVPHAVHPTELAETLAGLRVHPDLLTPAMVEPFIPLAREIDQNRDKRLALLLRTLAECMSIESVAIWLLEHQAWDFFAVYLDSIDHFCHGFMRYHPPRQTWISERDFELYHNVVSMAYRFHDQMLGVLAEKAGPDTTLILMSDHGFHPDHLRPASIPDVPAGPAVEHRDSGILAIRGPGIRNGAQLYGATLLDIAPTILTIYGLPTGEDMDGKVLTQAFAIPPKLSSIASWEKIAGADGCHPPHRQLDPVAAHEMLEQMIALGYIERPNENREVAVTKTLRELRYNLGEAYQDDARHREAYEIFRELHAADPDEQRFAARLFVSCQALEMQEEMRRIVDDLDGRRRALFEEARTQIERLVAIGIERVQEKNAIGAGPEAMLTPDERRELSRWRNLARFQPGPVDHLKAQVLVVEKRVSEAMAVLQRLTPSVAVADLYARLGRWEKARELYADSVAKDPDNAAAHLGLCRAALRRGDSSGAAQSALSALATRYNDPQAHFLLGRALAGMKRYAESVEAFGAAISLNPNFPEAHVRLAALLDKRLGDPHSAREHRFMARRMNGSKEAVPAASEEVQPVRAVPSPAGAASLAPREECLIVVTGLPRSGTSMLMQMLAAGGLRVLSDGLREADEDNPRGYFEFSPVKNLLANSQWLREERGRAIKIVIALLPALPPESACRVILCERDLDEVLDSQQRMLSRRNQTPAMTPERRRVLKEEYGRTLERAKAMLVSRPATGVLVIEHAQAISHPLATAERVSVFLGGGLDVTEMAAAIDPSLYRNRSRV